MDRQKRGFTLVEMLVVITIIGILMALLIPAVSGARESARRTQCQNNMRNIAQGILLYESNRGQFMGRTISFKRGTQVIPAPWTVATLPYTDNRDVYDDLADPTTNRPPVLIEFMTCPSDFDALSLASAGAAPLSYAANSGRPDVQLTNPNRPHDHKENGIFHYHFGVPPKDQVKVTLSYVGSKGDGASNTILLTEKLANDTLPDFRPSEWLKRDFARVARTEDFCTVVWYLGAAPQLTLRDCWARPNGNGFPTPGSEDATKVMARPSSNHSNGLNVVFADSSVRFLREDIPYRLYALLMTPHGKNAREPGNLDPQSNVTRLLNPPNNLWVSDVFNEADLQ